MRRSRLFFALVSPLLLGCMENDAPSKPITTPKAVPLGGDFAAPSAPAGKRQEGGVKERAVGELRFEFPTSWEEKAAASSVLLAEYQIPGDAGPGRLTFSTAGGGKAMNLDRWKQQFQRGPDDPEPQESSINVAGKSGTLIELTGTFTDTFGGGGAKPDWLLIGVVVPIDGDHNFFIKLTGPIGTLQERREEFMKFIQSARF